MPWSRTLDHYRQGSKDGSTQHGPCSWIVWGTLTSNTGQVPRFQHNQCTLCTSHFVPAVERCPSFRSFFLFPHAGLWCSCRSPPVVFSSVAFAPLPVPDFYAYPKQPYIAQVVWVALKFILSFNTYPSLGFGTLSLPSHSSAIINYFTSSIPRKPPSGSSVQIVWPIEPNFVEVLRPIASAEPLPSKQPDHLCSTVEGINVSKKGNRTIVSFGVLDIRSSVW